MERGGTSSRLSSSFQIKVPDARCPNMGLLSPHAMLWKTVKVPFDLALQVIQNIATKAHEQKLHESANSDGDEGDEATRLALRVRLRLAMDASLIGYKHLGNRSSFDPDTAVIHIAEALCLTSLLTLLLAPMETLVTRRNEQHSCARPMKQRQKYIPR